MRSLSGDSDRANLDLATPIKFVEICAAGKMEVRGLILQGDDALGEVVSRKALVADVCLL